MQTSSDPPNDEVPAPPTDSAPTDERVSPEDDDGGDMEELARSWNPPVMRRRAPPPAAAPPPVPMADEDITVDDDYRLQQMVSFLASPLTDEIGSCRSIVTGLTTLFVIGATLGVVSHKEATLPTVWYRYVSAVIGYIYFLCWSVSFYPQVISNYKRKSTHGLSPDFCALNVLGFACYTAYTASMYWSSTIQELYHERYGSEVTVQSNDVAFAIHALLLSSVTLGQIVYYRDAQRPSKIILATIVMILVVCILFPILVKSNLYSWLDYLYVLSFAKVGISLIKYIPQVILNYQRKSTVGWSIWNILLDFTGGLLSDLQLVLDCTDMGDFSGITGNLAKFGLGFVSITFDIIFMTQHYILYPESRQEVAVRAESEPLLSEEDRQDPPQEAV